MKKYIKPILIEIPESLTKRWNPKTCGYGLYIKNVNSYFDRFSNRLISQPIGWTCKHPNADINRRLGDGYYPWCVSDCPQKIKDIKYIYNILNNHD